MCICYVLTKDKAVTQTPLKMKNTAIAVESSLKPLPRQSLPSHSQEWPLFWFFFHHEFVFVDSLNGIMQYVFLCASGFFFAQLNVFETQVKISSFLRIKPSIILLNEGIDHTWAIALFMNTWVLTRLGLGGIKPLWISFCISFREHMFYSVVCLLTACGVFVAVTTLEVRLNLKFLSFVS